MMNEEIIELTIADLTDRIDNIEAIGAVFSNEKNCANYYLWEDENLLEEDRVGFFVSAYNDHDSVKIQKCNMTDIFGVTVDSAAVIGGQIDIPDTICNDCGHVYINEYRKIDCPTCGSTNIDYIRNTKYGLVTHTGLVNVRCELDVVVGDYVVSNSRGIATKTNNTYGCKVIAINEIHDIRYANIVLDVSIDQRYAMNKRIDVLDARISSAETNIVSAMNVANEAYHTAQNIEITNNIQAGKIDDALGQINDAIEEINNTNAQVQDAITVSQEARTIALSASVSAEAVSQIAVTTANDALSQVGGLTKELEPLTTWKDPEGSNHTGASYLAEYMNEGLATKAQIETVETKTEHALSSIAQNGKNIEMLVSSIDKYSVGEYSQAYGLTREQATNILSEGMVYIPTKHETTRSHSEKYKYTDANEQTQELEYAFTPGYHYVWGKLSDDSYLWIESPSISVAFFSEEIHPSNALQYWYIDSDDPPDGYEAHALYIYNTVDALWEKVNILEGNVNNRITSMIRQSAEEMALEITNTRGSVASLTERLTDTEAEVQSLTLWSQGGVEGGEQYNLATIKQTADNAGASIAQVVESVGEDGKVSAASIVAAVNNDTSGVTISADHINLKGRVTFSDLDEETQRVIELDTLDVQIWSSRGNVFKSRDVTTILTCHVFSAGVEITDTLPNSAFTWEKINDNGTVDTEWRATPYGNNANAIQITAADVFSRAVFNCAVEI